MRRVAAIVVVVIVAAASLCAACAPSVRFADREILWQWPDDKPIPVPKKRELGFAWEDARDGFYQPIDRVLALDYLREARNVNALDEVPDSSWFVDRRRLPGRARPRTMSAEELFWGALPPDEAPQLPLTVVKGKDLGSNPGFIALDARRRKYMIKVDPPDHLGITTSTEVVVSRLAWAAGWRVPGEMLIDAHVEQLKVDPHATVNDESGDPTPFPEEALRHLLAHVPRNADGTVRLLASRWLSGIAIGNFDYIGRVKDDPNDIVDHEARRDLRGFGVFAAWVNNIDTFENNTLDMYEGERGRGHVVHYQQDVGGSFGNWTGVPAPYWSGTETFLEAHLVLRSLLTLGFWPRPFDDWRYRTWKEGLAREWPEVGVFEAAKFNPRTWQPMVENAAFARQTARDRYWGAKRVAAFTDEELRAAIAPAYYRPGAAEHVLYLLGRRRDKIARAFFSDTTPLDYFRIDGERLCFADLWVEAGLGNGAVYRASAPLPLAMSVAGSDHCVTLPRGNGYRVVAIAVQRAGERHFSRPTRVHLMIDGERRRILGIER
jgi:hypothetical protein